MHDHRLCRMIFKVSLHGLENFGHAVQHIQKRQESRIAIAEQLRKRHAARSIFDKDIQRNFFAKFRASKNNLVVEFQRIVNREPRLNLGRNLEAVGGKFARLAIEKESEQVFVRALLVILGGAGKTQKLTDENRKNMLGRSIQILTRFFFARIFFTRPIAYRKRKIVGH